MRLAMAEAERDRAQAENDLADAEFRFTNIIAPFDGIMDRLHVRRGSLVAIETPELDQQLLQAQACWDDDGANPASPSRRLPPLLAAAQAVDTAAVARLAESLGWSWAYWQFDSDFILYDIPAKRWVEPIRDALIPPRAAAP